MTKRPTYEELEERLKALEEKTRDHASGEKTLRAELEERIRFEKTLTDISALFVNIPAREVDKEIEGVLRRVAGVLGVDRCSFMQFSKEHRIIKVTHSWVAEDIKSLIGDDEEFPWLTEKQLRGEIVVFSTPDELPKEAEPDRTNFKKRRIKSALVIPYFVEGSFLFSTAFGTWRSGRSWPEELIQRLKLFGEVIFNAILRKQVDLELRSAFSEIQELKDRLQHENIFLREEIKTIQKHPEIIGESDAIQNVLSKVEQVAKTNSNVLILGETGTGKELVARAIHNFSTRKKHTMVTVSCAALPASLVESELFGREKGAYTGAITKQVGRFELANGSTIFLDEIGELPMELQVKLLRVLQEGHFERLGSSKTISVDVRVIAATNRDLVKMTKEGKFREDLFYRLNVFPIRVPPLRERPEDILSLTWSFIKEFSNNMGKRIDTIKRESLEAMQRYTWPGNVRELRNAIERAMITSNARTLKVEVQEKSNSIISQDFTLEEWERRYIMDVLEKTRWRIRGKKGAAEILGLNPSTLYSRMKKLGIQRPDMASDIPMSHLNIDG